MERERELQKRFADLQQQKDDFSELLNQWCHVLSCCYYCTFTDADLLCCPWYHHGVWVYERVYPASLYFLAYSVFKMQKLAGEM